MRGRLRAMALLVAGAFILGARAHAGDLPASTHTVSGRVLLRDGRPFESGSFFLQSDDRWIEVKTRATGRFEARGVSSGEWQLVTRRSRRVSPGVVTKGHDPFASLSFSHDRGLRALREPIVVADRSVDVGDVRLRCTVEPATARLRGRVLDSSGQPVADAQVWLYSQLPEDFHDELPGRRVRWTGHEPTDPLGRFTLDGLHRQRALVWVQLPARTGNEAVAPIVVDLGNGQSVELTLRCVRGGSIAGTAIGARGHKLTVSATPLNPRGFQSSSPLSGLEMETTLRPDGSFEIAGLPPGRYQVRLPWFTAPRVVDVVPGVATRANFELGERRERLPVSLEHAPPTAKLDVSVRWSEPRGRPDGVSFASSEDQEGPGNAPSALFRSLPTGTVHLTAAASWDSFVLIWHREITIVGGAPRPLVIGWPENPGGIEGSLPVEPDASRHLRIFGDGIEGSMPVGTRFRFPVLPEGRYRVLVTELANEPVDPAEGIEVEVRAGEVTRVDAPPTVESRR